MCYYIDNHGNAVGEGKYQSASAFRNDFACVVLPEGRVCLVDRHWKITIRLPEYQEQLTDLSEGRVLVKNRRLYGFANEYGEELIPPSYLYATSYSGGVAPVQLPKERRYAFIDPEGVSVGAERFEDLKSLSEGLAVGEKAGGAFYVDRGMRVVLGPFERANNFSGGLACVERSGQQEYINPSGAVVFANQWDWMSGICVEGRIPFCDAGRVGFLDKTGAVAVPARYTDVDHFSEGIAIAKEGRERVAIDISGTMLFRTAYEWVGRFREGLARVRQQGKYGYLDRDGNLAIACRFAWADDFSQGLAAVSDTDKNGLFRKGKGVRR